MHRAEELAKIEPWEPGLASRVYSGMLLMHAAARRMQPAHDILLNALSQGIRIPPSALQVPPPSAGRPWTVMGDVMMRVQHGLCMARMLRAVQLGSSSHAASCLPSRPISRADPWHSPSGRPWRGCWPQWHAFVMLLTCAATKHETASVSQMATAPDASSSIKPMSARRISFLFAQLIASFAVEMDHVPFLLTILQTITAMQDQVRSPAAHQSCSCKDADVDQLPGLTKLTCSALLCRLHARHASLPAFA